MSDQSIGERRRPNPNVEADLARLVAGVENISAKIDHTKEALAERIGFTDRNAAQMVRLVEEKLSGVERQFNELKDRQVRDRDSFDERMDRMADDFTKGIEGLVTRVGLLENVKAKVVGVGIGIGVASGGTAGLVVKLLG